MSNFDELAQESKDQATDLVAHINQLIAVVKRIYFSLFFANIAALVAVFSTKDVDFFSLSKSISLPIISLKVNTTIFFYVAPIFLFGIYVYQHYYLSKLVAVYHERVIGRKVVLDSSFAHRINPWIISDYFLIPLKESKSRGVRNNGIFLLPFAIVILLTPLSLCFLWVYSFIPHNPALSIFIQLSLCMSLWVAFLISRKLFRIFYDRVRNVFNPYFVKAISSVVIIGTLIFTSILTFDKSIGRWNGKGANFYFPLYSANLTNAQLTSVPNGWLSKSEAFSSYFRKEYGADYILQMVACIKINGKNLRKCDIIKDNSNARNLFSKIRKKYLSFLPKVNLAGADLREARMNNVFMPGVEASDANFSGADLRNAVMEGGVFVNAVFEKTDLSFADLSDSNITKARFDVAIITGTNFRDLKVSGTAQLKLTYPMFFHCAFGDAGTIINTRHSKALVTLPKHWAASKLILTDIDEEYSGWKNALNKHLSFSSNTGGIASDKYDFERRPSECKNP